MHDRRPTQMCGRVTLIIAEPRMVPRRSALTGIDSLKLAPAVQHRADRSAFIVTSKYEQRRATGARWGLLNSWVRDNSRAAAAINAKVETIDTRGAFREAFAQRRCVVPADGFYDWTGPKIA